MKDDRDYITAGELCDFIRPLESGWCGDAEDFLTDDLKIWLLEHGSDKYQRFTPRYPDQRIPKDVLAKLIARERDAYEERPIKEAFDKVKREFFGPEPEATTGYRVTLDFTPEILNRITDMNLLVRRASGAEPSQSQLTPTEFIRLLRYFVSTSPAEKLESKEVFSKSCCSCGKAKLFQHFQGPRSFQNLSAAY